MLISYQTFSMGWNLMWAPFFYDYDNMRGL